MTISGKRWKPRPYDFSMAPTRPRSLTMNRPLSRIRVEQEIIAGKMFARDGLFQEP